MGGKSGRTPGGEGLIDGGEKRRVGEGEGGVEGDQDGVVEVFDDEGLQDREKVLLHRPSFPAPCSTILTAPLAPVARRNSTVLSSNRRLSTSLDRSANRLNARSSILVLTSFIPSTRRWIGRASCRERVS